MMLPRLINDNPKFELRSYDDEHDSQTVAWLGDKSLRKQFGLTYAPSLSEHQAWRRSQTDLLVWAIFWDATHAGNVSLRVNERHRKGYLEIYVGDASFRGIGLGFMTMTSLLEHAYSEMKLNRVYLCTRSDNPTAENLYRKLGFHREGCERQSVKTEEGFVDQNLWGLLACEWRNNSA